MNTRKYLNYLSTLDDNELNKEEDKLYDDCNCYNDCSICPHKFGEEDFDWELPECKLDIMNFYKNKLLKKVL